MIATIINAAAVVIGSLIGLIFHARVGSRTKEVVYISIGLITLLLGMQMAFEGQRVIYLALALVLGGIIGYILDIEGGILRFGNLLKRWTTRPGKRGDESTFAEGFLDASVLFCVGAMTIVGAFKAGVESDYSLLLTKSVMDGFMAIMLTSTLGLGVAFSAITVLAYQGGLTLLSEYLQSYVSELMLSEISGVGGLMILMIGLNLLNLRKIKTANFIPALVVVAVFVLFDDRIPLIGG